MGTESGIPFGNYTLLKRIARGGMAEVFVARQLGMDGFDRMVAIKRILPHLLDDKSFVRMFQDEARLAARLSHPNVIHIYDFGKVSEHFFIAMEYMHGVHAGELIRLAAEAPIPAALIARIGADACAGLHYAHNRLDETGQPLRLVHRDVSPPNLLVSFDGVIKIVDFGIAKAVSSIEQTRPGVVKGKYAYMSPEQTMGQKLNGRSDVFSLALVLWELLAGKPAVTRSDQILAMKTIRDGKVPPIEKERRDIPPALAQAIGDALHKDPSKRSDARAFGKALEGFIKSSNQIATSIELGAWLSSRVPREDLGGGGNEGTRQATVATNLASAAESLASELLAEQQAPERDRGSRGSVVARLSQENQETRVLSVASGDLKTEVSAQIRAMSTEGNSVVIDSGLIDGVQNLGAAPAETAVTRVLSTSSLDSIPVSQASPTVQAVAAPEATRTLLATSPPAHDTVDSDFASEEETFTAEDRNAETTTHQLHSAPHSTVPMAAPGAAALDHMPGNAQTFTDQVEAPTTEVGDSPFNALRSENMLPMAAAYPAHPSQGFPAVVPPMGGARPRTSSPRFAPLIVGVLIIVAISVTAMILSGDESKRALVESADAAPALLVMHDAQSTVPAIVVTPLHDAGPQHEDAAQATVLEIATRPEGADVFIDGQRRGRSPLRLDDLEAGAIEVLIELDGHLSQTRRLVLKADQLSSLDLVLDAEPKVPDEPPKERSKKPREPKERFGRLVVRTSPYSTVYHRGRKLGVTPLANVQLKAGRYRLTFKNPDHKTVTRTAIIKAGKTTKLDFDID